MLLDYNKQEVFTKALDIEDIGNMYLRGITEDGFLYYVAARTFMGTTYWLQFGPLIEDLGLEEGASSFSFWFSKFDYKEKTIMKNLGAIFNNPKLKIETIDIITLEELKSAVPSLNFYFLDENDACTAMEY